VASRARRWCCCRCSISACGIARWLDAHDRGAEADGVLKQIEPTLRSDRRAAAGAGLHPCVAEAGCQGAPSEINTNPDIGGAAS